MLLGLALASVGNLQEIAMRQKHVMAQLKRAHLTRSDQAHVCAELQVGIVILLNPVQDQVQPVRVMQLGLALASVGNLQEIVIWQKHAMVHLIHALLTHLDQVHMCAELQAGIVILLNPALALVHLALLMRLDRTLTHAGHLLVNAIWWKNVMAHLNFALQIRSDQTRMFAELQAGIVI